MEIVLPLVMAALGLGLGWRTLQAGRGSVYLVLLALVFGAAVYLFVMAERATGWDGLGYLIFAILGAAPALIGLLIGGLIGYLRGQRKRSKDEAQ